jgi:hypothetical protein
MIDGDEGRFWSTAKPKSLPSGTGKSLNLRQVILKKTFYLNELNYL